MLSKLRPGDNPAGPALLSRRKRPNDAHCHFARRSCITLLGAHSAVAALSTTNSLDAIVQLYQTQAQNWQSTLVTYAQTLFGCSQRSR